MSPQRAKTYARLFAALSLSVLANLLLFQPRLAVRGQSAQASTQASTQASSQASQPVDPVNRLVPGTAAKTEPAASEARAMRISAIAPRFDPAQQTAETIGSIQRELKDLGHYPGQIDGRGSQLMTAAMFAYQQQHGMRITAEPSEALLKLLILGRADGGPVANAGQGVAPGSAAEKLAMDIQQLLAALGYSAGRDGRLTPELQRAIRAYETDNGLLPPTGRVTAALVAHLQRKAAGFKPRAG